MFKIEKKISVNIKKLPAKNNCISHHLVVFAEDSFFSFLLFSMFQTSSKYTGDSSFSLTSTSADKGSIISTTTFSEVTILAFR